MGQKARWEAGVGMLRGAAAWLPNLFQTGMTDMSQEIPGVQLRLSLVLLGWQQVAFPSLPKFGLMVYGSASSEA